LLGEDFAITSKKEKKEIKNALPQGMATDRGKEGHRSKNKSNWKKVFF